MLADDISVRIRQHNHDRHLVRPAADVPHLSALPRGQTANLPSLTNGERALYVPPETPMRLYPQGYMPFQRPILWTPSGQTDSSLTVNLNLHRGFVWTSTARAEATCCLQYGVPTSGAEIQTYVDLWVRLHGALQAPRSQNR